jgi:hypothetical protein
MSNTIQTAALNPQYYMFGNKGAVWSNKVHITKAGLSTTLCGTPMLSTNHAVYKGVTEVGCEACIKKYFEEQK